MKLSEVKFSFSSILTIVLVFLWVNQTIASNNSFSKRLLDPNHLQKSGGKIHDPKLYLVDDDTLVQVRKHLPQRIYAVYLKEKKTWFFTLTNKRGKFAKPLELIHFNTVIPGKFLGAKNPYQKYRFTRKWKWKSTKRREEYFLWVLSKPQVFKRVMLLEPPRKKKK